MENQEVKRMIRKRDRLYIKIKKIRQRLSTKRVSEITSEHQTRNQGFISGISWKYPGTYWRWKISVTARIFCHLWKTHDEISKAYHLSNIKIAFVSFWIARIQKVICNGKENKIYRLKKIFTLIQRQKQTSIMTRAQLFKPSDVVS